MSNTISKSAPSVDQMLDLLNNIHLPVVDVGYSPLPLGSPHHFDVALGTVISGWLYADGSVYNIADYPELANHYASHHGASNFYGGNGTTTFAVPDLRGEFLRGSGTNGHANQGNGARVGEHQDATEVSSWGYYDGNFYYSDTSYAPTFDSMKFKNKRVQSSGWTQTTPASESGNQYGNNLTVRPTNTSYPIYIKATPPASGSGHEYSTTEHLTGDVWIDGKPIYEKTIAIVTPTVTSGSVSNTYTVASNIEKVIDIQGYFSSTNQAGGSYNMLPARTILSGNDLHAVNVYFANNLLVIESSSSAVGNRSGYATIRYTKTSD